jgi:hypothetical protein
MILSTVRFASLVYSALEGKNVVTPHYALQVKIDKKTEQSDHVYLKLSTSLSKKPTETLIGRSELAKTLTQAYQAGTLTGDQVLEKNQLLLRDLPNMLVFNLKPLDPIRKQFETFASTIFQALHRVPQHQASEPYPAIRTEPITYEPNTLWSIPLFDANETNRFLN